MRAAVHAGDLPATGPAITVRFRLNGAEVAVTTFRKAGN